MEAVAPAILANLRVFVAFARKKLGDSHLAEDVVQESLLKALRASKQPARDEEMVAWFYRILRRSIIDTYRRQDVKKRALDRLADELPDFPDGSAATTICQCFKRLMPDLPATYRELITRIDLQGESPDDVASSLGISINNLNVRLHRARQRLKKQLELTCKACSKHGCLDCTCDHGSD